MKYYMLNPTGNITALVRGDVAADKIMQSEPSCEQLGYLFEREGADIAMRMAGGEFCGNAAMCAAYIHALENNKEKLTVKVFVEGTGAVEVEINGNRGTVSMPPPVETGELNGFPLVRFKGIDHIIIEKSRAAEIKKNAEALIRQWCTGDALGFMFLEDDGLKPLVYVKSAGTLFWESSCASGTTAVGHWLGKPVKLRQPCGGILSYDNGKLTGTVELIKTVELQPDK